MNNIKGVKSLMRKLKNVKNYLLVNRSHRRLKKHPRRQRVARMTILTTRANQLKAKKLIQQDKVVVLALIQKNSKFKRIKLYRISGLVIGTRRLKADKVIMNLWILMKKSLKMQSMIVRMSYKVKLQSFLENLSKFQDLSQKS